MPFDGKPDNVELQASEHVKKIMQQTAEARGRAERAAARPGPIATGQDAMNALMSAVHGDDEDSVDAGAEVAEDFANEQYKVQPAGPRTEPPSRQPQTGRSSQQQSDTFNSTIEKLRKRNEQYHEVQLPSCGHFNPEIPGGVVKIRPLTARDELELASAGQRIRRGGDALNKMFSACIAGNVDPMRLCSEDRFYLLIYLRGISFGTEYELSIKCPECGAINKDKLNLDSDLFVMTLGQAAESADQDQASRAKQLISNGCVEDVFPSSGIAFSWGVTTGQMEAERDARTARVKNVMGTDMKLLEHYSNFVMSVAGISDPKMKQAIIRELPMADTAYLREIIGGYTFGVDQNFEYTCQTCMTSFRTGLPIDETFFSISKTRKH